VFESVSSHKKKRFSPIFCYEISATELAGEILRGAWNADFALNLGGFVYPYSPPPPPLPPKYLQKMIKFCDWLSETKMIIVRDSFFRKTFSIVLLSFIAIINQPRAWIVYVDDDPPDTARDGSAYI
jgi:hypothetical protein